MGKEGASLALKRKNIGKNIKLSLIRKQSIKVVKLDAIVIQP